MQLMSSDGCSVQPIPRDGALSAFSSPLTRPWAVCEPLMWSAVFGPMICTSFH